MTTVYLLMTLADTEYGSYEVYGVYSTREKAEQEMARLGGSSKVSVWYDDEGEDQYYIEEYEVQ